MRKKAHCLGQKDSNHFRRAVEGGYKAGRRAVDRSPHGGSLLSGAAHMLALLSTLFTAFTILCIYVTRSYHHYLRPEVLRKDAPYGELNQ